MSCRCGDLDFRRSTSAARDHNQNCKKMQIEYLVSFLKRARTLLGASHPNFQTAKVADS